MILMDEEVFIFICYINIFHIRIIFTKSTFLFSSQGTKIQAHVPQRAVIKYDKVLEEDAVFFIQKPQISTNLAHPKFVPHPKKTWTSF